MPRKDICISVSQQKEIDNVIRITRKSMYYKISKTNEEKIHWMSNRLPTEPGIYEHTLDRSGLFIIIVYVNYTKGFNTLWGVIDETGRGHFTISTFRPDSLWKKIGGVLT